MLGLEDFMTIQALVKRSVYLCDIAAQLALLERMKMEHLLAQLDGVLRARRQGRDYKGFLTQALEAEWRGRHQRGVESASSWPGCPGSRAWISSTSTFSPRSTASRSASSPA